MATLQQNINKAVEDFYSIKIALNNAGLDAEGATAEYADKINTMAIKSDYLSKLIDKTIASIDIPNGVTKIGGYMFYNCTNLASVTIPDTVTVVDHNSFRGCSSLISVTIPDSVVNIGSAAFYGCSSLTTINIPDSVTTIGSASVFQNCTSLETVVLGNGFNANGLDLSVSTLYSVEVLVDMLNALADKTGQTAYTLTLGSINLAKLNNEQIAIATEKNWILA